MTKVNRDKSCSCGPEFSLRCLPFTKNHEEIANEIGGKPITIYLTYDLKSKYKITQ
jgi:hypothetical protein